MNTMNKNNGAKNQQGSQGAPQDQPHPMDVFKGQYQASVSLPLGAIQMLCDKAASAPLQGGLQEADTVKAILINVQEQARAQVDALNESAANQATALATPKAKRKAATRKK